MKASIESIDTRLPTVNTHIYPRGGLDVLSRIEARAPSGSLLRSFCA